MFEPLSIRDAKPITILKKIFFIVIAGPFSIGAISSYRAYVQVRSLDLQADKLLAAGSPVNAIVVSSGPTLHCQSWRSLNRRRNIRAISWIALVGVVTDDPRNHTN